jgi:hypothetical protein
MDLGDYELYRSLSKEQKIIIDELANRRVEEMGVVPASTTLIEIKCQIAKSLFGKKLLND